MDAHAGLRSSNPAADALLTLSADDFQAHVEAYLGRDAPQARWDALTDPRAIRRTLEVLVSLQVHINDQLAANNARARAVGASAPAGDESKAAYFAALSETAAWRAKATSFKQLVNYRRRYVQSRMPAKQQGPQFPPGSGQMRKNLQNALEGLTRAVIRHRDRTLSGSGGPDDDDDLWDCLEDIKVPSADFPERTLEEWLTYIGEARAEQEMS